MPSIGKSTEIQSVFFKQRAVMVLQFDLLVIFRFIAILLVLPQRQCGVLDSIYNFFTGDPSDNDEALSHAGIDSSYDFIIVGGGSAGCVLANRLSEISNWKVLLIEAGGEEKYVMDIPQHVHFLQKTRINWDYRTEPSDYYCLAMENRQCRWPRGKVLGGSSVLNYMIYTRGNRKDYNNWSEMGNPGWDYTHVLAYFKKMERSDVYEGFADYRGRRGPLHLTKDFWHSPSAYYFLRAGMELGYPPVDYNGPTQVGVSLVESNLENGLRLSSNIAYLQSARNRSNLHVLTNSHVTKLIIERHKVVGVEYYYDGKFGVVKAKKEVILSAGAINTPQLLILSGIGPTDHLKDLGIPKVCGLSVGYNLIDHIAPVIMIACENCFNPRYYFTHALRHYVNYFRNRSSPLQSPGGCEGLLFFETDKIDVNGNPEIELLQVAGGINYIIAANLGLSPEYLNEVLGASSLASFMIFPMVMRPKSRGRVLLRDSNPFTKPIIIPNYLSEPEDVRLAIAGIRKIQEMLRTQILANVKAKIVRVNLPGCKNIVFDTDTYWECYLRHLTFNLYHYSGTAKMGHYKDHTAVVTPRLQVRGVRNLRVIDASIMPEIISGE